MRQSTPAQRGERRSAIPHTHAPTQNAERMKQDNREYSRAAGLGINWIGIFSVLLVIMIAVGIIISIANSRARETSLEGGAQTTETAFDTEPKETELDEENPPLKISVSYAFPTEDTIELGESVTSDYAILIDLSTNTIKAQKKPDDVIFPASMTKVMTLIVAYENCKNLNDTFTMTAEITDPLFIAHASVAGFSVGEKVTIKDLLYGAILPSGADATDALAIYTAGSIEGFVELMNKKVVQMGLSNTHFANPSGLHDDDHYSTVHEMALILEYALKIPECREILSTYQYTTRSTPEHPEGLLLTSTMFSRMAGDESGVAEVLGGKTGYTNEGLHCLASVTRLNRGGEYILVTAHAPSTYDPIWDCINVYKNLFSE